MKILVAQIGARRHYAVPVALHRAGRLESLHTDWCANRSLPRLVAQITPSAVQTSMLRRLTDRRVPEIPHRRIRTYLGYSWQMARLRRRVPISNYQYWCQANRAFGERVVARGFGQADTVYAFNAAAAEIFRAARNRGLRTVLDQTMAPWRAVESLLAEERDRWPHWEAGRTDDSWQALADREAREWDLADLIICGSQYVVDAIGATGGPVDRCRVVPYGLNRSSTAVVAAEAVERRPNRPLRVLYVGTVDLRKGVPYLLEAAKSLDPGVAEFRIVGPLAVRETAVRELCQYADVRGAVPRSAVSEHYRWADVLVLPTLAEGSANVCLEAMAHGLPQITTANAGSLVRHGVEGWIVPIRTGREIASRLVELRCDPEKGVQMSRSATRRASELTWDRYMGSNILIYP